MEYYISPFGRSATFIMKRRDGSIVSKASGKVRGDHPIYLGSATSDPLRQYPSYEVVTINGISEAIEHRAMEPIFYIADYYRTLSIEYYDGPRYPHLVRIEGRPDTLSAVFSPRVK
jgi:hypothetical protein